MKLILSTTLYFLLLAAAYGQPNAPVLSCGAAQFNAGLKQRYPEIALRETDIENAYIQKITAAAKSSAAMVYTLPVVVHIIHDNGPENISDAQVLQGINYLNDAFRNLNYYNPATGVDVEIEFCLAKRDLDGNLFNGIRRYQSPLTDMSVTTGALSAITNWDTEHYINITLVREACSGSNCNVAGYATYASMQGAPGDGIVMEAAFFGSSPRNTVVLVHEMGHYLGLLHTFNSGCTNNDCLTDGDRICDTPPDNTTAFVPCDGAYNSCQTDTDDPTTNNPFRNIALGGLGDQPDMHRNYMDYSPYECYDRFTEGQKARMRFFIETVRSSLLTSKVCFPPCLSQPVAQFTIDNDTIAVGETVSVTNLSSNASAYGWYIGNNFASSASNPTFSFPAPGEYVLMLHAETALPECDFGYYYAKITVICPVKAAFDYSINGNFLVFSSISENAGTLQWTVKDGTGAILHIGSQAIDSLNITGLEYVQICLEAANAFCNDKECVYVNLTGGNTEICNNSIDDDNDGLVDSFDPDCPCNNSLYQAYCPVDCEYIPDSFPTLSLKLKWVSEIIADNNSSSPNLVTGDIDGDGDIEVFTKKSLGTFPSTSIINNEIIFNGTDGTTAADFTFTTRSNGNFASMVSMADVDADGQAELFSVISDTILCHHADGTLVWKSENQHAYYASLVNIADFNGDGIPEVYAGNEIFNAQTGKRLIFGMDGAGCNLYSSAFSPCFNKHTIAADLLPSPGLELAAGNTVYQVVINNTSGEAGNALIPVTAPAVVKDGFTSVADINGDGELDVVVVQDKNNPGGNGIWVWDPRNGTLIASAPGGILGGIPFIGDVTDDCVPEIGMTFKKELRMYQFNGTQNLQLLYNLPTTDNSGFTGISMFDFNQDGKNELVYRDETQLRILEGSTGITLTSWPLKSITDLEYPVIADIDQDGQAEILINGYQSSNSIDLRVYCFETGGAPWAPARSVWNQYGYHVTNINDDLTVPRQMQNQAKPLPGYENCLRATCPAPYNAFMTQATFRTQSGCVQFPATDFSLSVSGFTCTPDSLIFSVAISNTHLAQTTVACVPLSIYADNPAVGSAPFKQICVPVGTAPELNDTLRITLPNNGTWNTLYFVVNDAGSGANAANYQVTGIIECDYANNLDSIAIDIQELTLNLGPDITKCSSEVITLHAGPGFESYLWSDGSTGSDYSTSFEGLHFVEATDQCHQIYRDSVNFIIDQTADVTIGPDLQICQGAAVPLTVAGDYDFIQWLPETSVDCVSCPSVMVNSDSSMTITVIAGKGSCFSADTVNIKVNPSPTTDLKSTICSGDSLFFNSLWLKSEGLYTAVQTNAAGCDSLISLQLQVTPVPSVLDTIVICEGDSVLVFGNWISESTVVSNAFTSAAGCDSLQSFQIIVSPVIHFATAYSLCQGDSIQIKGQWLSGDGLYNIPVDGITGCDSIYEVTITSIPPVFSLDTIAICEGDSIQVFGQWISSNTLITNTFLSAAGCDSIQSFYIEILPLVHQPMSVTLCQGDSVLIGNQWLSGDGTYPVQVENLSGCDTIFEVTVSTIPPIIQQDTLLICEGDSVLVFGQWIKNNTLINNTFNSISGCDSVQFIQVLVIPAVHQPLSYTLCAGDSVLVANQWLTAAGQYSLMSMHLTGCDTVFEVHITIIPPVTHLDSIFICDGDSVLVFGQWISTNTLIDNTFTSAAGCDSIQYFQIVEVPLITRSLTASLCEGDSILVGGTWLSGSGDYLVTVNSTTACDTIYQVTIIDILPVSKTDTLSICEGDSVLVFGQWIKNDALVSSVFMSAVGCDSTQYFQVIKHPLPEQQINVQICKGDSLQIGNQWLKNEGNFDIRLQAASGCDTILHVQVLYYPIEIQYDTVKICEGDSVQVNGIWVNTAGNYPWSMPALPCPVSHLTTVHLLPVQYTSEMVRLCPGDSILVNGQWIKESTTSVVISSTSDGCDSVHTLNIVAVQAPDAPQAVIDCENLEIRLKISADNNWQILWSNGDTTRQTVYQYADTAHVELFSQPDCFAEFSIGLPALPDTALLPKFEHQTIEEGRSLTFDLGLDPYDWEVRWLPADIFSCDTCMVTTVSPDRSITIDLSITHKSGCTFGGTFNLILEKAPDLFIPNVFSPNDDNDNDFWTFTPPSGIAVFDRVAVWDRWGELLADWSNLPEVNWDGQYKNRPMNPGVMVYYVSYTDLKGRKKEFKGDVTIVR